MISRKNCGGKTSSLLTVWPIFLSIFAAQTFRALNVTDDMQFCIYEDSIILSTPSIATVPDNVVALCV